MKSRDIIIKEWIDKYSEILIKRAIYLTSNQEDSMDIVQEVFISAYAHYDSFKGDSQPINWLQGILKYKVIDYYRKKYKEPDKINLSHFFDETGSWKESHYKEWENSENLLDNEYFADTFEKCINKLPPRYRIPLKMYYIEENVAIDICQEMGITTTNLWKILQRGRLQLKECLELNWFKS